MEEKTQTIECSVTTCEYKENEEDKCTLETIKVEPIADCDTCTPEESMCSSYKHCEE